MEICNKIKKLNKVILGEIKMVKKRNRRKRKCFRCHELFKPKGTGHRYCQKCYELYKFNKSY